MTENKNTNATYDNNNSTSQPKIEWLSHEPVPHFRYAGREFMLMNDKLEVLIDGVLYRVSCHYADSAFLGDVLDSLTMDNIYRRTA